ncbi:MAG: hypothetical protein OXB88_09995 [Bacteriovoracales bacterium]|nr:hypothetical protein [Bacteriovoracales bacterium]
MEITFSPHVSSDPGPLLGPSKLQRIFQEHGLAQENFITAHSNAAVLEDVERVYQTFSHKKIFVHIGMGGSSIGPRMLLDVLGLQTSVRFHFLDNSDPDLVVPTLMACPPEKTLFYVVSKSGQTTETLAILSVVLEKLKAHHIPQSKWRDHVVLCTGPKSGALNAMAQDFDLETLTIPLGVGGRFSALTPVGLLPARFAGPDLKNLLRGAERLGFLEEEKGQRDLSRLTKTLVQGLDLGYGQTVLMPYCKRLESFNDWFVQLWAESLGKEGKGLTPIAAIGAAHEHSQMQLFMEGPRDKFFIFIRLKNPLYRAPLGESPDHPSLKAFAAGKDLAGLITCQLRGTLKAMDEARIPYALITLDRLREEELGGLMTLFGLLTVFVGKALGLNPFDQPGVELGKRYASKLFEAIPAKA